MSAAPVAADRLSGASWAHLRVLAALGDPSAPPALASLSRRVGLPESQVARLAAELAAMGCAQASALLAARPPLAATAGGLEWAGPSPGPPAAAPTESPDPAPAPPRPRSSREVAGGLRDQYRLLFGSEPNLPWLMRQHRRAAALGQDLARLLRVVERQSPRGNPQAYLDALLRRLEGDSARRWPTAQQSGTV